MRTGTRIVILSCIAVLALYDFGLAYKTDTHERITIAAVSKSNNYLKFLQAFKINPAVANSLAVYGSFAEDSENRFFFHFYDPINNHGLGFPPLAFDPALLWGYRHDLPLNEYSWTKARGYMYHGLTATDRESRDTNFRMLSRSLGQIVHLVEDMAQPSHVRNDPHTSHYENTTSAFLVNPSHLEDWAQFHQGEVSEFINLATDPRSVDSYEDAFETLALFSNQNFFSDDTIFKDYPLPSKEETNYTDSFIRLGILGEPAQVLAEDGHIYTVPYIIKTQGTYYGYKLAQVGYFAKQLIQLDEFRELAFQIDDEVAKENAQILIPQAVGYSAGLLDYFFRGEMEMVKDQNTPGQYRIVNKSAEPMSGTFSLHYDDTSDTRRLVTSWSNLSINPNSQSTPVTFTVPTSPQPKEMSKYILVFNGTLGNEEGAVAGSLVSLGSDDPRLYVHFTLWDTPFIIPNREVYWDIENDAEVNLSDAEPVSFARNIRDIDDLKERTYTTSSYRALPCGLGRPEGEVVWSGPDPGKIFLLGVAAPFGTLDVIWEQPCSGDIRTTIFSERRSDRLFGYSFVRGNALGYLGVNILDFRNSSTTWDLRTNQITTTFMFRGDHKFGIYLFTEGVLPSRIEGGVFTSINNNSSFSGTSLLFEGGAVTLNTFDLTRNWAVTVYGEGNSNSVNRSNPQLCGNLSKSRPDAVHVRIDSFDYDGTKLEHVGNKHLTNLGSFWVSQLDKCPSLEGLVTGTAVE